MNKLKKKHRITIGTVSGIFGIIWVFSLLTGFNLFTWGKNVIAVENTSDLVEVVTGNTDAITKNSEDIKLLSEKVDNKFDAIDTKLNAQMTMIFLVLDKLNIQIPPNIKRDLLSKSNHNNHIVKEALVLKGGKHGKVRE